VTSPQDAALITESLATAAKRGGDLTAAVYARLFSRQPETQALFVLDTDGAARGEMLARVFDAILDFIGERRYAHHLIQSEALNHEGLNIARAVFATFFGIVAETVREACGAEWTEAMDDAWRRLLAELDHYMANPCA
jgi:hemoglobin-like flavoprotein